MTIRPEPAETLVHDAESRVELLSDHDLLGVSAARFSATAAPSPPAHLHEAHAEVFLVLDGAIRFLLDGREATVERDTWVAVPPGVVHTFRLDSSAAFLDLHAPSRGYGRFVRALSSAAGEQELARARAAFDQQAPSPGGGADPSSIAVSRAGGKDGETITDRPGRRVTLLFDTEELAVTETVYAPGERGPDPHVHHDHADAFLVVEGELAFTLRGEQLRAPAGTFVLVPPDVVHSFRNESETDARFFNLHAPSCGFGEYLRGRYPEFDQHAADDGGGLDPSSVLVRVLDVA